MFARAASRLGSLRAVPRSALGFAARQTARSFGGSTSSTQRAAASSVPMLLAVGAAATGAAVLVQQQSSVAQCAWYDAFWGGGKKEPVLDPVWSNVKAEVEKIISADPTFGPLFVRLAWHAAGTFDARTNTGGSNGATMRFPPECLHGANNGLKIARDALAPIQASNPSITFADLWTYAGCVAIEGMGGPKIPWSPGRTDAADGSACPPEGRLPDASKDAVHIRDVFFRMGFNDQEIVALIGAHTLGHCHVDRSGYVGPWTRDPFGFDNSYFTLLLDEPWRVKKGVMPLQFEDSTGELMMLPGDLALIIDPKFRKYVELYAKNEDQWHKDFAAAFGRLISLGVPKAQESK